MLYNPGRPRKKTKKVRPPMSIRHAPQGAWRLAFLLIFINLSCAIPVMPTGGPVDKTPPTIIEAQPESESVNVSSDFIRLVFGEYIDQASFAQSVSITPPFDRPLEYRWKKKRVDIRFPEPLRENTTYILTIDTNLKDVNRVALTEPITLAFATGPEINRGRINGRVLDALAGKGIPTYDVYAYAFADSSAPDSLPDRPDYRTQTDQSGAFKFDYMSEQPYFVIALEDRNRNRRPDGIEPFAVPSTPTIFADSAASQTGLTWLVTTTDTIPPELQRVRSLSNRRFQLRISESIQVLSLDPQNWSLRDSVSNQTFPVESVYLLPDDPKQVYITTPTLFVSQHILIPGGLADSSGNAISTAPVNFTPSASTDTLQLRFNGFHSKDLQRNDAGAYLLPPGQQVSLAFNQPAVDLETFVTITDSAGTAQAFTAQTNNGTVYALTAQLDTPLAPFEVVVSGTGIGLPDTTFKRTFQHISPDGLGELGGIVTSQDSTGQPVVELYPAEAKSAAALVAITAPDSTGRFVFSSLPDKAQYQFRAFSDRNGNQRWDGGQLIPYQKAEPVTWYSDSLQVRARWEQALPDTLRLPSP